MVDSIWNRHLKSHASARTHTHTHTKTVVRMIGKKLNELEVVNNVVIR